MAAVIKATNAALSSYAAAASKSTASTSSASSGKVRQIGKFASWEFIVSPKLIRGFKDLQISAACETETMVSDTYKYVRHEYHKPMEYTLTVHLDKSCNETSPKAIMMQMLWGAAKGTRDYFYIGRKKLFQYQMILTEAKAKNIVIGGKNKVIIACDMELKLVQASRPGGKIDPNAIPESEVKNKKKKSTRSSSSSSSNRTNVSSSGSSSRSSSSSKSTSSKSTSSGRTTYSSKRTTSASTASVIMTAARTAVSKAAATVKKVVTTAKKVSTSVKNFFTAISRKSTRPRNYVALR